MMKYFQVILKIFLLCFVTYDVKRSTLVSCVISGINKNICADKNIFDIENCGNHIVEK